MEHTTVRLPPFYALCAREDGEQARQLRAEESTGQVERMRQQFQRQLDDRTALLCHHLEYSRRSNQQFTTLMFQLYRDLEVKLAEANRQLSVAKQKAETCIQLERVLQDLNLRPVIDLTTDDTDFRCSICLTFFRDVDYFVVECGCVSLCILG